MYARLLFVVVGILGLFRPVLALPGMAVFGNCALAFPEAIGYMLAA
jgi:hypothetical protein